LAAGAAALPAISRIASAQTYPTRPITMIVPFPAGGPMDVIGRLVGERMSAALGRPIIVENVSGADGSVGTGRAARARPDGYTLDLGSMTTHVLNGAYYSLQYDTLNDFIPVAPLVTLSFFLFARRNVAASDLNESIMPGNGYEHAHDVEASQCCAPASPGSWLPARIVRAGGVGRIDQTAELGALRAQALDRCHQEAAAPQRAGDRACQRASPGPFSTRSATSNA
jgi:hypothetical protein